MEYGNLCNLRNMEVVAHLSICKSFEPKIDAYPKSKMDKKEKNKQNTGFNKSKMNKKEKKKKKNTGFNKSKMDKKEKKKKNAGFNVCVRCKICGKKFNTILDHNLHQLEHLED